MLVYQANTKLVENLKTQALLGNHAVIIDEHQEMGGTKLNNLLQQLKHTARGWTR